MLVHLKADLTDAKGNKAKFEMYPFPLDQVTMAIEKWNSMGFVRCTLDMALELYIHPEVAEDPPPYFEALSGPRGVPDNLLRLPHVSPQIEKKFNDLGIYHFWQIAELSESDAKYIREAVGLPDRMSGWLIKAREFMKE